LKNNKIILAIVSVLALAFILNWESCESNPNTLWINDAYFIKKETTKYSAYYYVKERTRGPYISKLIAKNIDSIIKTAEYGSMIYGENNEGEKKWFYIDASSSTNVYGGFDDNDFRKDKIEIIGKQYLDSVVCVNDFWNNNKEKN